MTNIVGIPTTRVSNLFAQRRVLGQVQYDQRELYRLQAQLSTGQRFEIPSADPVAAARILSLQSQLERKGQVITNLTTNQSFLSATDDAVSQVSGMVANIRATVLSVVDTTTTDTQRAAAAQEVRQAIQQILDAGNQKFRDRYLFAGTTTQERPFAFTDDGNVIYSGNAGTLRSYADIDLLFTTNVNGADIFGALSGSVLGTTDLNPVVNENTRLADLFGGVGLSQGSLVISNGNASSTIDLSQAETLGDVAALIQRNPPEGSILDVEITARGLSIQLNTLTPGDLSVHELGGGTVAFELGLLRESGVGEAAIVGTDLNPVLRKTTSLDDLLGSRARATLRSIGPNNDILLEADYNGKSLNDVTVTIQDNPDVVQGHEIVHYDEANKTLVVEVEAGGTQARHVVEAVNRANQNGDIPFTATLDPLDQSGYPGEGTIFAATAVTAYGDGVDFDRQSGLRIVSGNETFDIDLSDAETIEDVLNILNGSAAGVLAELNDDRTGINVRSRISGTDFRIGENGGTTANQLGLRTLDTNTNLADMNYGMGIPDDESLGEFASAALVSAGTHNDLILRATEASDAWNGFSVQVVDTTDPAGQETISWDPDAKTVTIGIVDGVTTASDLVDLFADTPGPRDAFELVLADENNGTGVVAKGEAVTADGRADGADFLITRRDGRRLEIDVAGAVTVQDLLDRINNHPQNDDDGLTARLVAYGNGIELVDETGGTETLTVTQVSGSSAAEYLGLVPLGTDVATAGADDPMLLTGRDVNPRETEGLFTAMLRLEDAIRANDIAGIERAVEMLDEGLVELNFTRADLGAKQESLDILQYRLDSEEIELKSVLSDEFDTDLAEVISNLTARQMALEASLSVMADTFRLSLLNFL